MTVEAHSWNINKIGDLSGRITVVTGASSGLGLETAKALAERGATCVLACRNVHKGQLAVSTCAHVRSRLCLEVLDLASLRSIRDFAQRVKSNFGKVDLLINNAGVMLTPYGRTEDGFELHLGINYLGHFALTGLLIDMMVQNQGSRIVNVTSGAHRQGKLRFEDLQFERRYHPWAAYCRSKLSNLLFTIELNKRLSCVGSQAIAVAAHPGWSRTELQRYLSQRSWSWAVFAIGRVLSQTATEGALPILRAATDPRAQRNDFWGPSGFLELKGRPVLVPMHKKCRDAAMAALLWQMSERLTNIKYPL